MNCSPPGSSTHGIPKATVLEWVAMPSSRDLSNPGIEPLSLMSPSFDSTTWEAPIIHQQKPKSHVYSWILVCISKICSLNVQHLPEHKKEPLGSTTDSKTGVNAEAYSLYQNHGHQHQWGQLSYWSLLGAQLGAMGDGVGRWCKQPMDLSVSGTKCLVQLETKRSWKLRQMSGRVHTAKLSFHHGPGVFIIQIHG